MTLVRLKDAVETEKIEVEKRQRDDQWIGAHPIWPVSTDVDVELQTLKLKLLR